jgi:uncharacterized protein
MAVKALIDTNIWVSAILNPHGFSSKLREGFKEGLFETVISEPTLEELAEVLSRPRIKGKNGIMERQIKEILLLLEERSEHVILNRNINVCRDKDDNLILKTAIKGRIDFIVTRDDDIKFDRKVSDFLTKYGILIDSVAKFLSLINKV